MSELNRTPLDALDWSLRADHVHLTDNAWNDMRRQVAAAITEDMNLRQAYADAMRAVTDARDDANANASRLASAKETLHQVNWEWLRQLAIHDDTIAADLLAVLESTASMVGLTQLETGALVSSTIEVTLKYIVHVDVARPRGTLLVDILEEAKTAALAKLEVAAEPNDYTISEAGDIPF